MTTDIRLRTRFFKGEALNEDESYTVEYKDFSQPSDPLRKSKLIRAINSFLNRRGGRIYIGITDTHIVKGIELTMKERDELKLYLYGLLDTFESSIKNKELVNVHFIPIFNPGKRGKAIPDLFIVKIIVRQGDPSILYSASNDDFEVYLRNDAQSMRLKVNEITDHILKRKSSPESKVPISEFDDPKPEPLLDVGINHMKQPSENKTQESQGPSRNNNVQHEKSNKAKQSTSQTVQAQPKKENEALIQKETKQQKEQKEKKKSKTNTVQNKLPKHSKKILKLSQEPSQKLITYQHYSTVTQQQIGLAIY